MRWPGVLAEALADPDAVAREVVELGRAAVAELATSRLREGDKLARPSWSGRTACRPSSSS